jgi:NCAIR mutase (PurE)-related protein
MEHDRLIETAQALLAGELNSDEFLAQLDQQRSASLAEAELDLDRHRRCGYPEVVFGQGKSLANLLELVERLLEEGSPVLVTRIAADSGVSPAHTTTSLPGRFASTNWGMRGWARSPS